MKKVWLVLMAILPGLALVSHPALAADSFYEGKTVRIIVGYPPGGGYDGYARAVGRHMGKYIPGNPNIYIENMPGAGGMVSANYLYKVAKPDGLSIAHFSGAAASLGELLGQGNFQFVTQKFEFIGAISTGGVVLVLSKASGIANVDEWRASKRPIKVAGVRVGGANDTAGRVMRAVLGLPMKYMSGYTGINPIRLALESGEVEGTCQSWYGLKSSWRSLFEAGDVRVIVQAMSKPYADLPKVPMAIDFAKTEEERQLIEVGAQNPMALSFPFVLPPGTPKDRVGILRKAFQETVKDKQFLAETEKAKMDIDPANAEELEKIIAQLFKADPTVVAKLKKIASEE